MKEDVAIIISAYNPDYKLKEVIKHLKENKYTKIIVINDGSNKNEIFKEIKDEITIINHEKNQGQGSAIKTGVNYVINNYKNIKGIITMDADGQHRVEDVNKLYSQFKQNNDAVIIGSRNFNKENVPFRSKIGNKTISYILAKKTNKIVKDTQTGLRIIPQKYLEKIKNISGERYEFTICFLLYCINNNINFLEIPIETIYIDKNRSSHYKIIKDSIKIYLAMNKEIKQMKK